MSPDVQILMFTAASIAFIHTLMGPDHYLPFVAMGAAKKWTMRKVLMITALCGLGHIAGSIVLGFIGVGLQMQIGTLEWVEAIRGDIAAWALIAFGLVYFVWGMRKAYKNQPHTHSHQHGVLAHSHMHTHQKEHVHIHEHHNIASNKKSSKKGVARMGPWAIFIIFVLGPCEPLIPLLMYPAAKENFTGLVMVTGIFGVVTMLTMLFAVWVTTVGINKIKLPNLDRFGHAIAGATIFGCGGSIAFLGL